MPHGVIIGPDGTPWITDGGLNAIVCVDPLTEEVRVYPLGNDNFLHLSHIHYPQNIEKYQGRRLNYPSLLPSDPHFVI